MNVLQGMRSIVLGGAPLLFCSGAILDPAAQRLVRAAGRVEDGAASVLDVRRDRDLLAVVALHVDLEGVDVLYEHRRLAIRARTRGAGPAAWRRHRAEATSRLPSALPLASAT